MHEFTGVVLAGGASRRMGQDKAFVEVDGRPLVAVAIQALAAAGAAELLVVGGDAVRLATVEPAVSLVADDHPGEGPLGGVLTALRRARSEVVAVLSCDLPAVVPEAVTAVVDALDDPAAAVALAVAGGRQQPLLAAYRVDAAPALQRAFDAGERSLVAAVAALDTVDVALADETWAGGVNTPAELHAAGRRPMTRQTGRMPSERSVPEIDVTELARRHGEGAWILDVRRQHEYVAGHVPGARLIPLDELSARADEVPKDEPVLVVCAGGGRSAAAVEALVAAGWDATNVAGGTKAWIEAGHPVVEGPDER